MNTKPHSQLSIR